MAEATTNTMEPFWWLIRLIPQGIPLSSLGIANFDFSGGGGNGVKYSSGCISQASTLSDYRIVSSRELLY